MMLEDPLPGGAGAGLLNTSIKSEGGLSGKGEYGEEEVGPADRTFDLIYKRLQPLMYKLTEVLT